MNNFVKKPNELAKNNAGFTIVELLIVIVVIAILAAITIVSYNGITQKSIEATMKGDLQSAVQLLEMDNTQNGGYPITEAGLNGGKGLVGSGSNDLTYVQLSGGYCVPVTSPRTSITYKVSNTSGQIVEGDCLLNNGGAVTLIAGSPSQTAGFANGNGSAALFSSPQYLTVSPTGVIYVADSNNNRIRAIDTSNEVTTYAGTGVAGAANGAAASATFFNPRGIVMDSAGNILVNDYNGFMIRKITPGGTVSTFAGATSQGYTEGTGTAARFYGLTGMAIDASDNLYVIDKGNGRIRKITPAGVTSFLAGSGAQGFADGNGAAAQFNLPAGIAVDSSGVVYVADSGNYRVRKIMPNGDVTTFAGSGTSGSADGTGVAAQFGILNGITIDVTGNFYIADPHRIRKITPAGVVTTLAGAGSGYANDTGTVARFNTPTAITVDAAGVLYVAESTGNRIRKVQ